MTYIVDPNGRAQYVPGVSTAQRVVSDQPGPTPDFMIPILLGGGPEGHPFNADATRQVGEAAYTPFKLVATSSGAKDYFGEDSDIAVAMSWAKRHGLPFAYIANMSALTRTSLIAASTGPIKQYNLLAKSWGAAACHIKIKATGGNTLEFTPIKHYSMGSANFGAADTRIYVKDNSWVRVGQTITIGDNTTANVAKVVLAVGYEFTSTGQKKPYIDLTTTVGSAYTLVLYCMVIEYDDANVESSGTLANAQAQIDWINTNSKLFIAVKETATFTNAAALVALAAAVAIKDVATWSTVVKGTSPAPASADYTAFVALMDATAWDAFVQANGVLPQSFYVADSSSVIQATMRDWAIDKRAEGHPISITTGVAWGDTVIAGGSDTDPLFRAAALNSQDVTLVAGGLDKVAAYLSTGPAVWARRVSGGLGHNLTNDPLLYSEVEKQWDERVSLNLTNLHKKGVLTYRLGESARRYVISQGLNTLQQNASAWNLVTNDTPLVMQRDLADFVDRILREDLDGSQVGADRVSPATLAAVIVRRAQKTLEPRGYIQKGSFRINSITLNAGGTGYDVVWTIKLPVTNDYVTVVTNIQLGE